MLTRYRHCLAICYLLFVYFKKKKNYKYFMLECSRLFFRGARLVVWLLFYTVTSSEVYSEEELKSSVLLMLECSWMRNSLSFLILNS